MSVSRRKFMQAGFLATVCAGIPLRLIQAAPGAQPRGVVDEELLDYYTKSAFDSYLNTEFRVYLGPTNTRTLTLIKTEAYLPRSARSITSSDDCFSLLLTSPPGAPFEQGTYAIEHAALGTFLLFLVAISSHTRNKPDYYEAVIFRLRKFSKENSGKIKPPKTGVSSQSERNVWYVSEGETVETPASRLNEKIKRDTFNISLMTGSSAIAANKRPAPVRATWLTMAQDPGIGGLKLGMTLEQVLALFPGSKTDAEVRASLSRKASPFGMSSLTIRPQNYSSRAKFVGINQIAMTLLDGRVATLYVGYESPAWGHVDGFVTQFSKGKNMPAADSWEAHTGMDSQLKSLKCQDYEIRLYAGGQNVNVNYVQMIDLTAQQKLKEREAKAKG